MKQPSQTASLQTELNPQRKAALAGGGAFDHAGRLRVEPVAEFDLNRTIFGGLTGIGRRFMVEKLARQACWDHEAAEEIEAAYVQAEQRDPPPPIDARLIDFMVTECDFSMEHADGTFLEHLVFCHHYAARYYPGHSPNVALLHSILGTATNTFAMQACKISALTALLTRFEAIQVQAFPSVLRLLYNAQLLPELKANIYRLDKLEALHCYRVIDKEPLVIDAENFWINLNYHLMHFVDFMPSANWSIHRADPLLQMFSALSDLLDRAGQRQAKVEVTFPGPGVAPVAEQRSVFGRIIGFLPPSVTLGLARKSIQQYSAQAGHDLNYHLDWHV